jgi:hypothetical protein
LNCFFHLYLACKGYIIGLTRISSVTTGESEFAKIDDCFIR